MKLKNKLLVATAPIAAIATITPALVMSSCSCSNKPTLEIDLATFDEETYQWKGQQLTGTYTNSEMTNKYYEFIKSNPVYLAEELLVDIGISNDVEVAGTAKAWINNIDTTNHKVSLKVSLTATVKYQEITMKENYEIEFSNLFYVAEYDTEAEHFELVSGWTTFEAFKAAKDWSLKMSMTFEKTGEAPESKELVADANSTDVKKQEAYEGFVNNSIDSHYMAKCAYKAG